MILKKSNSQNLTSGFRLSETGTNRGIRKVGESGTATKPGSQSINESRTETEAGIKTEPLGCHSWP